MMIVTAVLGIGFIFALAGDFVLWAKLDEQRKATAEEYNRRWDEISRATGLENEIEQLRKQCEAKDYAKQRMSEVNSCLRSDKAILQDHLSALLCPMNDHVWEVSDAYRGEFRCKKCGRKKDGT